MSDTPGTPQTLTTTSVRSVLYEAFEMNVCVKKCKRVRNELEEEGVHHRKSHNHKMFTQQNVLQQIIHIGDTLCNSCRFWINCSLLLLLLFFSLSPSRLGFYIQRRVGPVVVFWLKLLLSPPAAALSLSHTVIYEASCSKKYIPAPGTCTGEKRPPRPHFLGRPGPV